jgi:hypothetical protein
MVLIPGYRRGAATPEDALGGKVCALVELGDPRDSVDVAEALRRWTAAQLIAIPGSRTRP